MDESLAIRGNLRKDGVKLEGRKCWQIKTAPKPRYSRVAKFPLSMAEQRNGHPSLQRLALIFSFENAGEPPLHQGISCALIGYQLRQEEGTHSSAAADDLVCVL